MEKLGLDITNKNDLVGICYTMWFNAYLDNGDAPIDYDHNVSDLLKEYEFTSDKGFVNSDGKTSNAENYYHYWGRPAQGYYRSTDKKAHRKNMELIAKADVDFIVCDYTFATYDGGFLPGTSAWNTYIGGPLTALLDTIVEMRAEGLKTPYVVLWPNSPRLFEFLYDNFVGVEKWKDCFVYWNNKPFIMTWIYGGYEGNQFETVGMYGLQGKVTSKQWSYLEVDNSATCARDDNGNPLHMTACVATQRTYMTCFDIACGRDKGRFWNNQWKNVFDVHPKIMTVTWWNEWGAILFHQNDQWFFTDNFNQEYSRDIEPMEGGHGDLYYRWLCEYVKCYKAHESCPELIEK